MAKRKIKITDKVLDEKYLGKYKLVIRTTKYEYSPKPAKSTFSWEWTPAEDKEIIALFSNPNLKGQEDYYGFKWISSRYDTSYAKDIIGVGDIEIAKTQLQRLVNGTDIFLSHKETQKWVTAPNVKNHWGFNANDLKKLIKAHQKADKVRQFGYEERLTDANFHTFCSMLSEKQYDKCLAWIDKEFC